jgi:monofunctional biosynthetic peptidoglycan transglycosylase
VASRPRKGPVARFARAVALGAALWVVTTVGVIVALRWIDPPTSAFMLQSRIGALVAREPRYEFRHEWRDWDQISREAALAVVAAEDQQFPQHNGFDFQQIDKALADRERGGRMRGASTISQQVAKNLFLWSGQSWFRKGLEACITLVIELTWSKQRILEVYLNIAAFGRGTYGVEAAAQRFFRKSARNVNRPEAALLAAVLPNPVLLRADAPSSYVRKRQRWIEQQMHGLGGTTYISQLE